jgi:hypothetical protein
VAHTSVTLWKVIEVCGVCVPHGQWIVYCVIHLVVLCNRIVRNGNSATLQSFIPIVVFVAVVVVCGGDRAVAVPVAACMCGLLVVCGFSSLTAECNRLVVLYYNWI